jgi:hypothetical protein
MLPSAMPAVPPFRAGWTPNRNGRSPSGGSERAAFQYANAASKPGRSPPLRRSTTSDQVRPDAVSAGGIPRAGSISATRDRQSSVVTGKGASTPASAAAVTLASRK